MTIHFNGAYRPSLAVFIQKHPYLIKWTVPEKSCGRKQCVMSLHISEMHISSANKCNQILKNIAITAVGDWWDKVN